MIFGLKDKTISNFTLSWVGDDPQYYRDPEDLFEKQKEVFLNIYLI